MTVGTTPLPSARDVRELLAGLLGRDVEVTTGGAMVDPAAGALVGVYVDRQLGLRALVLLDAPLAAYVGAALGLVPARTAAEAAELRALPPALAENAGEVLNVTASLFNAEDAPHVRLDTVHETPGEPLPADVATWVHAYVRRVDLTVAVDGYGSGAWSLLVL
jgi:hypothetical protein